MLLWATAGVPLGVYNIVEDFNLALKIQPQILITLSLITWAQCLHYGGKVDVIRSSNVRLLLDTLMTAEIEILCHKMHGHGCSSSSFPWCH